MSECKHGYFKPVDCGMERKCLSCGTTDASAGYAKKDLMEIEWTERGITEWQGTMAQFRNEFPTRHLEYVDGKEVRYICEGCNLPIIEGDIVYLWTENETCEKCGGPEQIKRIA